MKKIDISKVWDALGFNRASKLQISDITFKYSTEKLFVRLVIGLIFFAVYLLLVFNQPLWHLRPYMSDATAYILLGQPRFEHYISPEPLADFRNAESRFRPAMEEDVQYLIWSIMKNHDFPFGFYVPLEAVRILLLSTLFAIASPIFRPRIFTNKRVFARLTKTHFYYYNVWPIIPYASEKPLPWESIKDVQLKLRPIWGDEVIVSYVNLNESEFTFEEDRGKTHFIHIPVRYCEDEGGEIYYSIYKHMKDNQDGDTN